MFARFAANCLPACAVFALATSVFCAPAHAQPPQCAAFADAAKISIRTRIRERFDGGKEYLANLSREIVYTRGARIFVRPQSPTENDWRHFYLAPLTPRSKLGFFGRTARDANPANILFRWAAGRDRVNSLRIFMGTVDLIIQEPTSYFTWMFTGMPQRLTLAAMLVASSPIFIYADHAKDDVTRSASVSAIERNAAAHAPEYLQAIDTDYRFHDLKARIAKGQLTQAEAALTVEATIRFFDAYYNGARVEMFQQGEWNREKIERLLTLPFFSHLKPVIEIGVGPTPGYRVDRALGPLSDLEAALLLSKADRLYIDYQIIEEFAKQSELWPQIRDSEILGESARELEQNPFTAQLMLRVASGRLSRLQLRYRLQEAAFWRNRIESGAAIGVHKLKEGGPDFVKVDDILTEILDEIDAGVLTHG